MKACYIAVYLRAQSNISISHGVFPPQQFPLVFIALLLLFAVSAVLLKIVFYPLFLKIFYQFCSEQNLNFLWFLQFCKSLNSHSRSRIESRSRSIVLSVGKLRLSPRIVKSTILYCCQALFFCLIVIYLESTLKLFTISISLRIAK